ncbi:hypothetical protein [Psychroflexus sediminis]|uniref:DUF4382 domain-containing protein n=1 Tax=Psychroflexus sediminis TaxID=470826 RepID=A0A1G7WCV9_9FLAO|nr:hypothetical protein [Psychroflexus sediminis]SDG69855.1 hypothetical protein SAMN04488027_105143 [Psychroflexus sediminis]
MKILKPVAGILAMALLFSCSTEDSNPDEEFVQKSNLEIRATATTDATTASEAKLSTASLGKASSDVEISEFFINIRNIELEFAEGFGISGDSSASSDDEDDSLNFDELPSEITTYLEENYPNDAFCQGELEDEDDEDDPYKYEIELQSGTEIYFRSDFSVYATEIDDEGCENEDDDDNEGDDDRYDFEDDFELTGPFELNLSSGVVNVIEVEIPVGEYDEVEFEMDRSENPMSDLYQKSILMRGTVSGIAFEFFHTFSEEFEVDYEDAGQNLIITEDNNNAVVFEFDLVTVFNLVDLSNATDNNGNGIIEISPEDNDGNRELANRIKEAIKDYVDLSDD